MPSLFNTTVAANYGRMSSQDTYGTGQQYSNFGTRNLRLLKIVLSGGSNNDLTLQDGTASGAYADANSLFGLVVKAVQTTAEIMYVGQPTSTTFMVLVAGDTENNGTTSTHLLDGSYSDLETAIAGVINGRSAVNQGAGAAGSATTVTITATGTTANTNMFVGGALGTFA
jgi:hypothetical protein